MTDCSTPEDGLACQKLEPKLLALRFLAIPRLKRQKSGSGAGENVERRRMSGDCRRAYNTPAQAADAMRHGAWAVTAVLPLRVLNTFVSGTTQR